jgi:hypothetical protein
MPTMDSKEEAKMWMKKPKSQMPTMDSKEEAKIG